MITVKKLVSNSLKWLLPLGLTVLLLYYMFSKVDFVDIWQILTSGVDYGWILCAMTISIFSHVFRALRWRIQLRSLGINPPLMAVVCSIFGTYALNLVFPRLGEIWRCTYIAEREKKPFTEVVGTMMSDRITDTLMVLGLTLLTFLVAAPAIESFLDKYPIGQDVVGMVQNPWNWVILVAILLIVCGVFYFGRGNKVIIKIMTWVKEMWRGFATIGSMDGKWAFICYTFAIWGCYFTQLYVAFFAFDFTRDLCTAPGNALGLLPCLVAFVLSSIGMAVPSNGGLGPWNIAVMFGLAIYGVTTAQGTAFSILQWSGQTVMLIILGLYTIGYIIFDRKKKEKR